MISHPAHRPPNAVYRIVEYETTRDRAPDESILVPRRANITRTGVRQLRSHFRALDKEAHEVFTFRAWFSIRAPLPTGIGFEIKRKHPSRLDQ
ncbi:hypothetical protein X961_3524 [Burkholderia pseudomallei MSHR5613]|nr:hypothetical protein DM75_964 [Burkholderia mallei]KGS19713.1 hypothetical protein X962_5799 [Burkholderia pseudomallei MSHR7343]KGS49136.1 hypothetical protein X961_3524 [Burkholderia pseudomallei MSHR5613]KGS53274.1 hypothetical protein X949_5795 [Burkholderia pseudomallei MSHR5609]KGS76450.1 hypothetical protein X947_5126 [Burkholderia pseudomallei MSHR7334]KGX50746.1 hypothetical protein Y024_5837 [Burkholderia pseudomallei TSV44]